MSRTLTALFDDYDDARYVVSELERAGVANEDISIVARDAHGEHASTLNSMKAGEDAGKGAGVGATVGGVGGLLAGLGLLAIPGLGPVVAAGWLVSTLVGAVGGAVVGGAAGGLVGALTKSGVSEDDAHVYAEGVRRGGALVTVRAADDIAPEVQRVLQGERAVDIERRREAYRDQGWGRFDDAAPIYTPDEVTAERARYR